MAEKLLLRAASDAHRAGDGDAVVRRLGALAGLWAWPAALRLVVERVACGRATAWRLWGSTLVLETALVRLWGAAMLNVLFHPSKMRPVEGNARGDSDEEALRKAAQCEAALALGALAGQLAELAFAYDASCGRAFGASALLAWLVAFACVTALGISLLQEAWQGAPAAARRNQAR